MGAAQPWMKFYPRDWRADEKLRMCSLAARGLWMEMLALMHGSERYGHLLINGRAPTDAQLAVLAGAPAQQVPELIGELESAGVFSRTAAGAIYSRRMTDDERKAKTARKNGKAGGNPKLCKQTDNSALDKRVDKDSIKPPLKLRSQRPEKKASPKKDEKFSLPEGWRPEPFLSGKCKTIIEGWSAEQFETQFERFKAHHQRNGNKWVDWQAAWQTWALNSVEFKPPRPMSADRNFEDIVLEDQARRKAVAGGG